MSMTEDAFDELRAELAALREEFAKERRPVYETIGNPSFSTSGTPPSRYLCTKCMRTFAVSDETCPTCALTARAVRAEGERDEDLRMAWTIGACFGKEHHRWTADDYRGRSLTMSANACLGLTEDGQSSVPEGHDE